MLQLVFTLDYEIHGNGDGCPLELMVEPTDRMLDLFDCYGAKLTIMAEVAEILRFREHAVTTGRDQFGYEAIVGQLRRAVASAHDVQLHLHPSYCRAVYRDGRWQQDYASYDLARLGHDRLVKLIGVGKAYLEDTLRGARSHYTCSVFRAGHWSMHPSRDVVEALATDGIRIDTSVFKWGRRDSLVKFDYGAAWHRFVPWPIDVADVCKPDPMGSVFEVPICAEHRPWWAFVTLYRLHRMLQSRVHRLGVGYSGNKTNSISSITRAAGSAFKRHAWKLDFNQCTGRQLVRALRRAERDNRGAPCALPIVLIGHSNFFTRANVRNLRLVLEYVARRQNRFAFARFDEVDFDAIRRGFHGARSTDNA